MRKILMTAALTIGAMAFAATAAATPLTYHFSVDADEAGPLQGQTGSGSFTFDNSVIPGGGGVVNQIDLFDQLDFLWNGIAYDETTVNTGALQFDADGNLMAALFGNDCDAGVCYVTFGTETFTIFGFGSHRFVYSTPGQDTGYGSVTIEAPRVPEPATALLLGAGLAGLGLARRRKPAA